MYVSWAIVQCFDDLKKSEHLIKIFKQSPCQQNNYCFNFHFPNRRELKHQYVYLQLHKLLPQALSGCYLNLTNGGAGTHFLPERNLGVCWPEIISITAPFLLPLLTLAKLLLITSQSPPALGVPGRNSYFVVVDLYNIIISISCFNLVYSYVLFSIIYNNYYYNLISN